jgi:hypothetical protein
VGVRGPPEWSVRVRRLGYHAVHTFSGKRAEAAAEARWEVEVRVMAVISVGCTITLERDREVVRTAKRARNGRPKVEG